MVPDKFDMVDMEGIDLIESQGVAVPGLYEKLVESITQCRYQCLYNWKFNGIIIPPTYVEMVATDEEVTINGGVSVDLDDVIHISSIEPEPILPVVQQLNAVENGSYVAPEGVDGYNPVTVSVVGSVLADTVYSTSGSFSYQKEIIIPVSAEYQLLVQGYVSTLKFYINGVEQPLTLSVSADYTHLYYAELNLAENDILLAEATSSGRSIMSFYVIKIEDL